VTYIVQRYASLAAFFYLAAMASYAWWRLRGSPWLLALMAITVVLAVLTKQNAATVFLALPLIELLFFRRLAVGARLVVAAATLALALGVYWLVNQPEFDSLTRETQSISRRDYLATQVGVLWWYVGHFFYPTGQRLEFDFPLVTSFTLPAVLGATVAHLAALTAAFLAWRRAPLVAFGILFWYLAHAIESSILPITDLAFEHRTYLPNAGLVTVIAVGVAWAAARHRLATAGLAILTVAALGTLSWLTWERNRLWQDPVAFLQHDVEQSPQSERAWTSLGKELLRREHFEEALQAFGNALNLARTDEGLEVQPATLVNTVIALHHTGQHRKGFEFAKIIPLDTLRNVDRSRLHEVRGMTLARLRQAKPARYELTEALKFHDNPNAAAWLAYVELIDGETEAAAERALAVLARKPDHALALQVLERADPDAVPELLRSVVPP
jgi:tetratricopeptide (TPR) repeat protein